MATPDATAADAERLDRGESGDQPAEARPVMLVPLFGSSDVRAGAPVLRALARARGADVLLLDLEQPLHGAGVEDRDGWLEERRAALSASDLSVRTERRVGHNLEGVIIEAVAEHAPELLIFTWQRRRTHSPLRDELELADLLIRARAGRCGSRAATRRPRVDERRRRRGAHGRARRRRRDRDLS